MRASAHLARTRDGVVLGFYAAKSHHVVDIPSCPLLVPELDEAWRSAYASRADLHRLETLELAAGDTATASAPPIASIGGGDLEVAVEGIRYRFVPSSFFQSNRTMLAPLVRAVREAAGDGASAVDLFAGVGLFTIPLARRYARVVAVESDSQAAALARANAAANDAPNVEVEAVAVASWLERTVEGAFDLVLLDPPRTGLGLDAARELVRIAPPRIVYVSCDPSTLARDAKVLVDGGYRLEHVEAFDLFPQTFHVESVATFSRAVENLGR